MADYTDNDKLRELAEQATPGPWYVEQGGEINKPFWLIAAVLRDRYGTNAISSSDEATIRFIAACSPDVILALVAELVGLRTEVDQLRGEMPDCNGLCLTAAEVDVFVKGNPVAHAHISCPLHGDPAEMGRRADRLLDQQRAEFEALAGRWRQLSDRTEAAGAERDALQARIDAAREGLQAVLNGRYTVNGPVGDRILDVIEDQLGAALGVDPQKEDGDA